MRNGHSGRRESLNAKRDVAPSGRALDGHERYAHRVDPSTNHNFLCSEPFQAVLVPPQMNDWHRLGRNCPKTLKTTSVHGVGPSNVAQKTVRVSFSPIIPAMKGEIRMFWPPSGRYFRQHIFN